MELYTEELVVVEEGNLTSDGPLATCCSMTLNFLI